MKKETLPFKPADLLEKLSIILKKSRRYSLLIFLVFVGLIYGFVLFRIHSLSTAQPSETAVSSQVKAARIPRIDQSVVRQLQTLQDNSVSVQALVNQARSNPFQ
jgi:hypothetical protein